MTGILIIHGFAGTRDELKPLYTFLLDNNFNVSIPVLKGHETTKSDFANSKRDQWIKTAEAAYLELANKCNNVVVIGFSMGGLIAINLYQKYKFSKLITINTPIYYWDFKCIAKNILTDFNTYFKKYFTSSANKPIRSLWQFQRLVSESKPLLKNIDCDCLIIQTQDDDTVNAKSADYIYKKVFGNKHMHKPISGGHILFMSNSYADVLKEILHFIKKA